MNPTPRKRLRSTWSAGLLAAAAGLASAAPVAAGDLPAGWTRLADLPVGLAKFGLSAADGRLYAVGGYDTRREVHVYDIAANRWSAAPPLPRGTDNVAALAAGGRVYAIGGEAGTALQVLEPASGNWAAGPPSPQVRFAAAAAAVGTRLHLAGGWNADNRNSASLASHDAFDTATGRWQALAPLATPRNAAAAAALGDRVYVAGGRAPGIRALDQQPMAGVEVYDATSDRWAPAPPMPTARAGLAVVALGGRIYAFGGEDATRAVSDAVERFDPASGAWTALPPMPYRSHGLAAVAVGPAIYVVGGFGKASDAVGSESMAVYRYLPPP